MAQNIQFDRFQPGQHPECQTSEALLADAVDQVLSPADQAWFEAHIAACEHCSALFADAQRGAAWLEMLKLPRPEPSANLLHNIFAQTSDFFAQGNDFDAMETPATEYIPLATPAPSEIPQHQPYLAPLLPFRARPQISLVPFPSFTRFAFEPRLAMTAAMAFFSIALTLNLTGVRLDQVHLANLKPSSLKRTFYEAKGDAARHYDGLRVVHVLESRVDDLKSAGVGIDFNATDDREDRSSPEIGRPRSDRRKDQSTPPQSHGSGQPQAQNQSSPRQSTPLDRGGALLSVNSILNNAFALSAQKRGRV